MSNGVHVLVAGQIPSVHLSQSTSTSFPTSPLAEGQPAASTQSKDSTPNNIPYAIVEYSVIVYEIFTMETNLTILRPPDSTSPVIDLADNGFLGKTPILPNAAIGFRTLELFHRLRLRKASYSVEAFTRMICDYYVVRTVSLR